MYEEDANGDVSHATPGQAPVADAMFGAPPGQQSLIPPTLGNQMQSMQSSEPPQPRTLTPQQVGEDQYTHRPNVRCTP